MPPGRTIIIGIGNPILGDDGAGWRVAEAIKAVISDQSSVEVECLSLGGLSLMERLVGYERAILIDALESGEGPIGSVRVLPLDALPGPTAGHTASAHDMTLMTAMEMGRRMGLNLPRQVMLVAIEAKNVYDFCEVLSTPVAEAVPLAVEKVVQLLEDFDQDRGA